MKVKVVSLITMLLLLCSCQSNNSLERVKMENKDNITLQKENLYGKWKLTNILIYDRDLLIHSYSEVGSVSFDEKYFNICIDNNCSKLNYKIENNNILIVNDGKIPSEYIDVSLLEQNSPVLSLSYSINELKHTYVYELEKNA